MHLVRIILCLLLCLYQSDADKILLVPGMMTSHIIEQVAVGQGLLERDHQVYITLSTAVQNPSRLLHPGLTPLYYHTGGYELRQDVIGRYLERGSTIPGPDPQISRYCRSAMRDEHFRKQIDELKFDLAIVDCILLNFCFFLLPHVHRIPYVCMSSSVHPSYAGSPANPSFVPETGLFMHFTDNMTFVQRLLNLFFTVMRLKFPVFKERYNTSLLQEYAPELASWEELLHKSDLFIRTNDHYLAWPVPAMPNLISVPGITYKPAEPLPQHLEDIVKQGDVILVAFGSVVSEMPTKITDQLIHALNQFDETVIWRLSGTSLTYAREKVRPNIHIVEWLPQNDILGHKNMKLFLTHCGNNGVYEAIYHAVPIVGLPIFSDQFSNSFRMQEHGFGLSLWPEHLMSFASSDLVEAMREVLSNPKYKASIQKSSDILKDSPMPVDIICYWIEHVLKHGSRHLRSHGMELPWYQFWMLDILLFLVGVLFIALFITLKCVKCICGKVRKAKAKNE